MVLHLPQSDNIKNPDLPKPDVTKARALALEIIALFRKDFDMDKIDTYFLTTREYNLLSKIAATYGYEKNLDKSLEIWFKLKINYERNHKIVVQNYAINTFYVDLLANLGITYKLQGRWEECLDHATENMVTFLQYNDIKAYSRALYQRAYSLMKLGRTEEGKSYYNKFFMLSYVFDGYAAIHFDIVKKEYEDVFGGVVDEQVDWCLDAPR